MVSQVTACLVGVSSVYSGSRGLRDFRSVGLGVARSLGLWVSGSLGLWVSGPWFSGTVDLSAFVSLGLWVSGSLGLWISGPSGILVLRFFFVFLFLAPVTLSRLYFTKCSCI